jgi:hypothetical protein
MKKILFIGNSQLGNTYNFFKKNSLLDKADFWCVPGGWGPFFKIESNKLILEQRDISSENPPFTYPENLADNALIDDYEIVYISSAGFIGAYGSNYNIMWRGLLHKFNPKSFEINDPLSNSLIETPISESLYDNIFANELPHQGCLKLIELFSKHKCRIFVEQMPLFSLEILEKKDFILNQIYEDAVEAFGFFSKKRYETLKSICDKHNAILIDYPKDVVVSNFFTHPKFCTFHDLVHVNIDYAELNYNDNIRNLL